MTTPVSVALESALKAARRMSLLTSFAWVGVQSVAHAFAGRRSLCGAVALPKNWLKLGRDGAVCLGCSRALRDRRVVQRMFNT